MPKRRERGLAELYRDDPARADALLWGRRADPRTRRGFLRDSGLAAMAAALGAEVVFAPAMPAGLVPVALAQAGRSPLLAGKDPGLVVLSESPLTAEMPAHLLDDDATPTARMFVRNNGDLPPAIDAATWTLRIDGEAVERPIEVSLAELRSTFEQRTLTLQLECAGNGRAGYVPAVEGSQWTTGAIACPRFTGVRLREVLARAGVKANAVYIGWWGADRKSGGASDEVPISRGVPIAKAMEDETLIAWAIDGEPLPLLHGAPLRLVCPGWPGSASGKWLRRIAVRDRVHDGAKMTGHSYRLPCKPVAPGAEVAEKDMCILEAMPVKSIITKPTSGAALRAGQQLQVTGHSWAGDGDVAAVDVSIDFGQTWRQAVLDDPPNRLAWQRWRFNLGFRQAGYYEIWAQATDNNGRAQPMVAPGWNPEGYANNMCHRIAVRVA
jgi:DMSO/TMAO reductase YedYZ molybdopterin-dependent catalytic subunit